MSSEKFTEISEMRIMKNRLNEATTSLYQDYSNESSDLFDCRTSTPVSCYVPDGSEPPLSPSPIHSALRRFGMYRTPSPVSYYIDRLPSSSPIPQNSALKRFRKFMTP